MYLEEGICRLVIEELGSLQITLIIILKFYEPNDEFKALYIHYTAHVIINKVHVSHIMHVQT